MLPFKNQPLDSLTEQANDENFQAKAELAGNSVDSYDAEWVDPAIAGLRSSEEIRNWWFQLLQAMGIDDFMVRRALRSRLKVDGQQKLTEAIVRLRPEIEKQIVDAGVDDIVHKFHTDTFNPISPLGCLLYTSDAADE